MTRTPIFYIFPGLVAMFGSLFFAAGVGDIANYGGGTAAWFYTIVGAVLLLGSVGVILGTSGAVKA